MIDLNEASVMDFMKSIAVQAKKVGDLEAEEERLREELDAARSEGSKARHELTILWAKLRAYLEKGLEKGLLEC